MLHADPSKLQFFYGTAPQPCPYIPGRLESKAVTELGRLDAAGLHDVLSQAGFRRSHSIAYRPACQGCRACVPVRVRVADFRPTRSMRRALRRNADLTWQETDAFATPEQYALFQDYEQTRHGDGEMALMDFDDYRAMVEDTPIETHIIEFRDPSGRLVAVSLTDRLGDGLSGVYKFFADDRADTSPGTYVILWHIEQARAMDLPYVYLGYWIAASPKMAYKARFQPMESLTSAGWRRFVPAAAPRGRDRSFD
ncbi:MAG: arginyltransferase [Alphaproteobacteria bacterium]|jgi:arginine-tRNA-protein transferase|nr:arginyltransferase [Alphaproteobacteria bacterium]